jgi:Ca2+-binding RTX toxin-like protein
MAAPTMAPERRGLALARALLVLGVCGAVSAVSTPAQAAPVTAVIKKGTLVVSGTGASEKIALRRGAPGRLVVDVGANGSAEFNLLRSKFTKIVVNGGLGKDLLKIDESKGVFTDTEITTLNGQGGIDNLLGGSAGERLNGGPANDTVDGSKGVDKAFLGPGNDKFIYDEGDGADQVQGETGIDQVLVRGTAGPDSLDVVPGAIPGHIDVSGGVDIVGAEKVTVTGLAGDDAITGGAVASLATLNFDGGDGNDTLNGGDGSDILNGGLDNDTIDGNEGDDSVLMGAGTDTFVWDAGDGFDEVSGGDDLDSLSVNGSSGADTFVAQTDGALLYVTDGFGDALVTADGIEDLNLTPLGGADDVTIDPLDTVGVATVDIDLGVAAVGDFAADVVRQNATSLNDSYFASAAGASVVYTQPPPAVAPPVVVIIGSEAANDSLVFNGLAGQDTLTGGPTLGSLIRLTLDGGDGSDTLNGGNGADVLLGGSGSDTIDANAGSDTVFGGSGNDTAIWDPGDGSDVFEGQDGVDTLLFNGSAGAELFTASANGGRVLFTRNVGNIIMDIDDVETLDLNALAGTDTVTVNSLASTDLESVIIDLGVNGSGDAAADAVVVNGTASVDAGTVSGGSGTVSVLGVSVPVSIFAAEPANDTLTISLSGGADVLSASDLANTSVLLTLNGGAGDDVLVGSQGNDTINGDADNDWMRGNAGNDTFNGGLGTDYAEGNAGTDVDAGGNETFAQ